MTLWVPPTAVQQERAAAYAEQTQVLETLREWNKRLELIDPMLQLVKASDNATLPGLRPSYYHVLKHNPGGAPGIVVHEGPNGEYMEPNSYLLERLKKADLWNDRARKDREKRSQALSRAAERQREREREERVDETHERLRSKLNTQVLIG